MVTTQVDSWRSSHALLESQASESTMKSLNRLASSPYLVTCQPYETICNFDHKGILDTIIQVLAVSRSILHLPYREAVRVR